MIRKGTVFAAALLLAVLVNMSARAQVRGAVSVTGTLIEAGVICRAMQGDDGVLYTMRRSNALAGFKTGDRIKVTGTIAEASICQQGTTIDSPQIEKVK
jgi:hypothetical protein